MACGCKRKRNRCRRQKSCCRRCDDDDVCFAPSFTSCPINSCKNKFTVCGKVQKNSTPVHMATVTVTNGKNVYAECMTDCNGNYFFTGESGSYLLCAHKGGCRSKIKTINSCNQKEFNINFCL